MVTRYKTADLRKELRETRAEVITKLYEPGDEAMSKNLLTLTGSTMGMAYSAFLAGATYTLAATEYKLSGTVSGTIALTVGVATVIPSVKAGVDMMYNYVVMHCVDPLLEYYKLSKPIFERAMAVGKSNNDQELIEYAKQESQRVECPASTWIELRRTRNTSENLK
jgi:hypothetical protein